MADNAQMAGVYLPPLFSGGGCHIKETGWHVYKNARDVKTGDLVTTAYYYKTTRGRLQQLRRRRMKGKPRASRRTLVQINRKDRHKQ